MNEIRFISFSKPWHTHSVIKKTYPYLLSLNMVATAEFIVFIVIHLNRISDTKSLKNKRIYPNLLLIYKKRVPCICPLYIYTSASIKFMLLYIYMHLDKIRSRQTKKVWKMTLLVHVNVYTQNVAIIHSIHFECKIFVTPIRTITSYSQHRNNENINHTIFAGWKI